LTRQEGERSIFETVISLDKVDHKLEVPFDEANLDGLRENTLVVFTFGFSVKLFPPFTYVVQFRAEVDKDSKL